MPPLHPPFMRSLAQAVGAITTVALMPTHLNAADPESPSTPSAATDSAVKRLPTRIVEGERIPQYSVLEAAAATKSEVPVLNLPAAVQVVPASFLEDRQILSIQEGLKSVSGVQAPPSGYYDDFLLRGFDT